MFTLSPALGLACRTRQSAARSLLKVDTRKISKIGDKYAKFRIFAVEGLAQ
jgi:hypothetical protein